MVDDVTAGKTSMSPVDERLKPHTDGYRVLWRCMLGYSVIRREMDRSAVLGIEMGRAEFAALRSLTYDEHLADLAKIEIIVQIEESGVSFVRPDPPLSVLVVDRPGVRFALKDGGYVGPDEPDDNFDTE